MSKIEEQVKEDLWEMSGYDLMDLILRLIKKHDISFNELAELIKEIE